MFLLLLLLLCCCFKEALAGILALLGLNRRKRTEETYIEEHHSHRYGSDRPERRTWFGTRPSRVKPKKKTSGLGGLAGVGAGLGALALILGLKRKREERYDDKSTVYGTGTESSYYSDYTATSASE